MCGRIESDRSSVELAGLFESTRANKKWTRRTQKKEGNALARMDPESREACSLVAMTRCGSMECVHRRRKRAEAKEYVHFRVKKYGSKDRSGEKPPYV